MRGFLIGALAALMILSPQCSPLPPADGLAVCVSISPQAFLVERIGGAHVRVVTMLRPGESPATFQPSDYEVSEVKRAKVYFRIGVPFEKGKWMETLQDGAGGIRVVDMRLGIPLREMGAHFHPEEDHGEPESAQKSEPAAHGDGGHGAEREGKDPHIWLSPKLLKIQARTVAQALGEVDPGHRGVYRENVSALLAEIDRTDAEIREILGALKVKRLYVFHPAWGYFCDAYGLEQVAVESEGKEPSDVELTRLMERFGRDGVKVVFVQPQIGGKTVRAIASSVGAEVRSLDPLAKDVLGNLRHVAQSVVEAYP